MIKNYFQTILDLLESWTLQRLMLRKKKEKIAKILKISKEELVEKVNPLEKIYAIADHSKALLYALSDGGLPSNVGGGYNLRVILRRALNFIEQLDSNFEIEWVIEEHAKYLKKLNPELVENLDHVNKIIDSEKRESTRRQRRE